MRDDVDYLLLFDGQCRACSELAAAVTRLAIAQLDTASYDSELVSDLELDVMTRRPALVMWTPDGRCVVRTGVSMRITLVRLVGLRRCRTLLRLARAEFVARRSRRSENARRTGSDN